jgi:hypothetical protein
MINKILFAVIMSLSCCVAALSMPILQQQIPVKDISLKDMKSHKYDDVLKSVIIDIADNIMRSKFPVFVPLGMSYFFGDHLNIITLENVDIVAIRENLQELGYVTKLQETKPMSILEIDDISSVTIPANIFKNPGD